MKSLRSSVFGRRDKGLGMRALVFQMRGSPEAQQIDERRLGFRYMYGMVWHFSLPAHEYVTA